MIKSYAKVISIFISLAFLLTCFPIISFPWVNTNSSNKFVDIDNHWAKKDILFLVENNVVSGVDTHEGKKSIQIPLLLEKNL